MRYRFPLLVVLVCSVVACSDRSSPAGPASVTPRASAAEGRRPDDVDQTFVWEEASAICGFPVEVHASGKSKVIALSGDRVTTLSPALVATVTNLATGATRTLSITGALGWKQGYDVLEAMGDVTEADTDAAYELGGTIAALVAG